MQVEMEAVQSQGTNREKNGEKLAKDEGRQQGVLQTIGNVEQVRRTIAEHGFLEQGKGLWDVGQGTRDTFAVNRGDVVWDQER